MSVDLNWHAMAPAILVAGGLFLAVAGPALKQLAGIAIGHIRGRFGSEVTRSADAAAPGGFSDHVATVLSACPNAPYEIRLAYLIDGLTEAETLRREIKRLNGTKKLNEAKS